MIASSLLVAVAVAVVRVQVAPVVAPQAQEVQPVDHTNLQPVVLSRPAVPVEGTKTEAWAQPVQASMDRSAKVAPELVVPVRVVVAVATTVAVAVVGTILVTAITMTLVVPVVRVFSATELRVEL
jgi:hypothetical protein